MEEKVSVELKQHIELRGDDPLDAVIAGTIRIKAYLVANLAMLDGVEAAVKQYNISPAEVHAALAFYYDNKEAIQQANAKAMELIRASGGHDAQERRAEILRRQQEQNPSDKQ